jgi:transcriptional regulator with XRE-family HTH domain
MYNFTNFGRRVQDLRKGKNLTQEDLAHKVGVSGQAVSKWENNQSYPDITLIPDLASILGTSVSYLFGEQPKTPAAGAEFPTVYRELPLVHSTDHVACYSNKPVTSTDESSVKFTDESTAELTTRIAVNKGPRDILFLTQEDVDPNLGDDAAGAPVTSNTYEFPYCQNAKIAILSCICEIKPSPDDKTRVYAKGTSQFMKLLDISAITGSDLKGELRIGHFNNSNKNMNPRNNQLVVELPGGNQSGHLELNINGNCKITSVIPLFNTGRLTIDGCGSIKVQAFETACDIKINGVGHITGTNVPDLNISIDGSGEVTWIDTEKARVSINGSGDVSILSAKQVGTSINGSGAISLGKINGGDFSAKIAGRGSIGIKNGACQKFDVDMVGSGVVDATNVTANKAHIVLHQNGEVTLGHVIESSTEQIKKKGTVTVLYRGL